MDAADHMKEGNFREAFDQAHTKKPGNGDNGGNDAGLTADERQKLHELGFSDEDILEMGPAEARKLLEPPPDDIDLPPPPDESKVQRCDQCGVINSKDAKKCNNCGADLGVRPPPHPGRKADYMTSKSNSRGLSNVGNVRQALDQEPALMNAFGFDEMQHTEMLMRPLFMKDPKFKPRPITDTDIIKVQRKLQWFGFRKLGMTPVRDAITEYAYDHPFNPVRDYLDRCAANWDGKPRVGTWLCRYAGAPLIMEKNETIGIFESNGYTEEVGKMFLIGMVARIYEPGCKFDYMLILEGMQGIEKSKMCETLVGEEYFSDDLPDLKDKDAKMHLRGKWLIEMAEMHVYTRAEIQAYKKFASRQIERYRPTYGRKDVFERRTACFIGTTNKLIYLRDETGNRRSWPVTTTQFDIEALKHDRDQLWGEAVHLYRKGVHWWPNREFEKKYIRPQQDARFEPDPLEPLIKDYLAPLIEQALNTSAGSNLPRTTIIKIAVDVLGFTTTNTQLQGEIKTPIVRLEPKIQGRISAVLHHLGWRPMHNKRERWWEPGPEATET
jgi:predicted P-loop ATPase